MSGEAAAKTLRPLRSLRLKKSQFVCRVRMRGSSRGKMRGEKFFEFPPCARVQEYDIIHSDVADVAFELDVPTTSTRKKDQNMATKKVAAKKAPAKKCCAKKACCKKAPAKKAAKKAVAKKAPAKKAVAKKAPAKKAAKKVAKKK